ncbi:MAG: hypothetical protein A2017_18125 [Lentisphaerae bacterium GWF2_44_16]|nr:MAG: hypothetical protein A2017_18125 [Lentisphaerae bacterium GWF2_44_16]
MKMAEIEESVIELTDKLIERNPEITQHRQRIDKRNERIAAFAWGAALGWCLALILVLFTTKF